MFHFNFTVGISEISSQAEKYYTGFKGWFIMHTKELNTNSFKY